MRTLSEQATIRAGAIDLGRLHELAGEQPGHLGTIWYAGPVVGQAADAASTLLVLRRNPNTREGNPIVAPLVARPAAFVAVKLAVGAGLALGAHMLARDGHMRAAKVFSGVASALGIAAAAHNVGYLR